MTDPARTNVYERLMALETDLQDSFSTRYRRVGRNQGIVWMNELRALAEEVRAVAAQRLRICDCDDCSPMAQVIREMADRLAPDTTRE